MNKAKLIATAVPWALISAILIAFGVPPQTIAFFQAIHAALPDIMNIAAPIVTTGAAAYSAWKAKETPPK